LLACALLFDRIHFPGVSLPQGALPENAGTNALKELDGLPAAHPEVQSIRNLTRWATELPTLGDLVYLPDKIQGAETPTGLRPDILQPLAANLIDDTYGEGTSSKVLALNATEGWIPVPLSDIRATMVFTWPLYQARAIQYAYANRLPLVSDDPRARPPLPAHPATLDAKTLAQQIAIEALQLALPTFQSVNPIEVAEFRSQVEPMVKPFRLEMVKLTTELHTAIVSGLGNEELIRLCRGIAEARVLPAARDLARQLREPLRPWHKVILEITEVAVAAAASTVAPHLTLAWVIFRGAKIASEYAVLVKDREGKRKSGLSLMLHFQQQPANREKSGSILSDWDRNDWRCSGFVKIADPDAPVYNKDFVRTLEEHGTPWMTARNLFQTRTESVIWAGEPLRGRGPGANRAR
jgi:hypothetical protein